MLTTHRTSEINNGRLLIPDLRQFLQEEERTQGWSQETHLIKGVLLCFCRRGTATIRINYTTYTLTPENVLAILPTHIFRLEEPTTVTTGSDTATTDEGVIEALIYTDEYWTAIAQSIDYQLIRRVERNPLTTLSERQIQELAPLMDIIRSHEEPDYQTLHDTEIERVAVRGTAYALLMLLISGLDHVQANDPHSAGRKEELTHEFFDLLAQYYETERRVSFYASKLCVTPKYLSTVVKEVTQSSISEWINNVTILNIKRRLRTGTESIRQIAEALNFQTASTMVRYFHHLTGTTPSRYRNGHALA
jgi:AraC-like DNA-binding protein